MNVVIAFNKEAVDMLTRNAEASVQDCLVHAVNEAVGTDGSRWWRLKNPITEASCIRQEGDGFALSLSFSDEASAVLGGQGIDASEYLETCISNELDSEGSPRRNLPRPMVNVIQI